MASVFLLSWDQYGLETIVPVSEIEAEIDRKNKEREWVILADPEFRDPGNIGERELGGMIQRLILRAQVNPQRNYEIYTIHVESGITGDDIKEMFEQDPQYSAELIRERGNRVFSNRSSAKVKIT